MAFVIKGTLRKNVFEDEGVRFDLTVTCECRKSRVRNVNRGELT